MLMGRVIVASVVVRLLQVAVLVLGVRVLQAESTQEATRALAEEGGHQEQGEHGRGGGLERVRTVA